MELKDELTRCLQRREQFHVRLDNLPLPTCERDGRWIDIMPIKIDADALGRSLILYRKRQPQYASPWTASSLEEAMAEAQHLMGVNKNGG